MRDETVRALVCATILLVEASVGVDAAKANSYAEIKTYALEKDISEIAKAKGTPSEAITVRQMLAALANAAAIDVPLGDYRALSAVRLYQATGSIPEMAVRWSAIGTDRSKITCIVSRQASQIVWSGHAEMNPSERRWRANCQAMSPIILATVEGVRLLTRERLKERLRDPEGTRYRDVVATFSDQGVAICGEINMRNAFGGLTGYQRFISTSEELSLPTSDGNYIRIVANSPDYCTGPTVRTLKSVKVD